METLFSQVVTDIQSSEVGDWKFYVFVGVSVLIILGTVVPSVVAVVKFVVKAQAEVHKTQVVGLMEHQKEQIVRICDSHTKSFERSLDTFEKSMATRDKEHAAIMTELREIRGKIDNLTA